MTTSLNPMTVVPELPAHLGLSSTARVYRQLLMEGLKRAKNEPHILHDLPLPAEPERKVRFATPLLQAVDTLASEHGHQPQELMAKLIGLGMNQYEQIQRERNQSGVTLTQDPRTGLVPKSEQQRQFYSQLACGLTQGAVLFCEGSTGLGKSRAMAAVALEKVRAGIRPVILAAPTVSVVEHLYEQISLLKTNEVRYGILPGASEFVDDLELRSYLDAADDDPQLPVDENVRDWVRREAPTLNPDRPLARQLGLKARWLMQDLRELASDMPVEQFRLRSAKGKDEQGQERLDPKERSVARELLDNVRLDATMECDIILCTHAMLALGQKTIWKVVPAPAVLMVDEAHLFEPTVSNINSEALALSSLRARLVLQKRKAGVTNRSKVINKALAIVRQLTDALCRLASHIDLGPGNVCLTELLDKPEMQYLTEPIRQGCLELHKALNTKTLKSISDIEHHIRAVDEVAKSLKDVLRKTRIDVSYSPVLKYPSILCGPASVASQLRHIWSTAKHGVALVSATLYTPNPFGQLQSEYLQNVLSVPVMNAVQCQPVIDPFIYEAPELWRPDAHAARQLVPPGVQVPNFESALNEWHSRLLAQLIPVINLANGTAQGIEPAKGGVMVLMTAYRDIAALSALLEQRYPDIWQRCVFQQPHVPFRLTLEFYRKKYIQSAGHPILFALGSAWTGVDLVQSDVRAEDDLLLTDLVIGRLPIGLNQSNTMRARTESMGITPIIHEALLTFKQGLGRLMRRPGVKNRRIWVLDGRVVQWPSVPAFPRSAAHFLRPYKNVKVYGAQS